MCLSFLSPATSTSQIYTLSLHDALPISFAQKILEQVRNAERSVEGVGREPCAQITRHHRLANQTGQSTQEDDGDRKSTRLNSSHRCISYAVFCLKKKT